MPRITIPLAANYDPIIRPIMISIAKNVRTLCNLPQDTPLILTGEFGSGQQLGRAYSVPGNPTSEKDELFNSKSRLTVTGIDLIKNEEILTNSGRNADYQPMWEDNKLGISLRPIYIASQITLDFRYTASTQSEAIKFRDEHAVKRSESLGALTHLIKYDIPVGEDVLTYLAHFHELRETIAGYGENFTDYFKKHQCREWTVLGAQDADELKGLISIPEIQRHVLGEFDFSDIPTENKVDGNTTWEIQFSYRVTYHRCTHLYLAYPLAVHQQHIAPPFFNSTPRFSVDELNNRNSSIAVQALDSIKGVGSIDPAIMGGVRWPLHDDWIPQAAPRFTKPVVNWMLSLDPDKPSELLDLNDLPDVRLTLEMINYLKASRTGVFKIGRSAINLQVWVGDTVMSPDLFYLTEDLVVMSYKPMSLRAIYHVRLAFNTFYDNFTAGAVETLLKHPYAAIQIFTSIVPTIDAEHIERNGMLFGKFLKPDYAKWFYDYIRNKNIGVEQLLSSDLTKVGWVPRTNEKDPAIGSGSTWKGWEGDPNYHPEPGYVDTDGKLPTSFNDNRRWIRLVQHLAILTKRRED